MNRIAQVVFKRHGLSFVLQQIRKQGKVLTRLKFAEEAKKSKNEKTEKKGEEDNSSKDFFRRNPDNRDNLIIAVAAVMFGIGAYEIWTSIQPKTVIPKDEFLSRIKEQPVTTVTFYRKNKCPKRVVAYDSSGKEIASTLTNNTIVLQEQINNIQKEKQGGDILMKNAKEINIGLVISCLNILIVFGIVIYSRRFTRAFLNNLLKNARTRFDSPFKMVSKSTEFGPENQIKVTFKDVAGLDGPKEEIQEVVEFLCNPERFHKLGAKIPRGALLVGPPGTGKTLLAKACAGEANVPFFAVSGSEFVEMYVGLGAARVRDLFKKAKAASPAIIFIDEIDAIGKERSHSHGNSERENTLNQLFVEMDGFGTDANIVVLAATNRKQSLDPALIRPGRFDRLIEINLPSIKEREDIFGVHLRKLKIESEEKRKETGKRMAALTNGMSGAEIMSICNEAALSAAKADKDTVKLDDFYEAYDRVFTGLKRKLPLKSLDRKWIAYREAGRAVTSWFLKNAQQVLKVTITPRSKNLLGHTATVSKELQLSTKEELYDMLKATYGGRVAEELVLGTVTTGSADDLIRATQIARTYVSIFGIGNETNFADQVKSKYQNYSSPHLQQIFDKEVFAVCEKAYEEVKELINKKKKEVAKLAEILLEKETIELDELTELLGRRNSPEYDKFAEYIKDLKDKKSAGNN